MFNLPQYKGSIPVGSVSISADTKFDGDPSTYMLTSVNSIGLGKSIVIINVLPLAYPVAH